MVLKGQTPGVIHVCCPIAPPPQGPPLTPSSSISFVQQPAMGGFHRPSQRPNARQPGHGGFLEDNEEEEEEEDIEFINPPVIPTRFPQTRSHYSRGAECVLPSVPEPRAPITEPPVPPILPTENECGSISQAGSATPWAVGVGVLDKGGFQVVCGGALISYLHVVIAAHCLHNPAPTHVRLGNLPGASVDRAILTWVHPDYHAASRDNDLALLTLATPVSFSDNIRPVCLPFPYRLDGFVGQQVQVLGWGSRATVENGTLRVIGLGECRKAYSSPSLISDNKVGFFSDPISSTAPAFFPRTSSAAMVVDRRHLCGSPAPSAPSSTTCLSDFGAPLIYLDLDTTGKHFLVGVSSRGEGCDAGPGLYTRVGYFLPWLAVQLGTVQASTQSTASSSVPSPSLIRRVPDQTHRSRG
ncbi:clotting factor G beta subunit-like [Portunus trituberculatus]|uniref:clotting factor G beta subunit-like n=1 Tax=Portunus trituberculatus TaxID=210409 RepID=UPI001E1CBD50|nr:clotting factor G beta subunit-like [Portunus trituberculatus]